MNVCSVRRHYTSTAPAVQRGRNAENALPPLVKRLRLHVDFSGNHISDVFPSARGSGSRSACFQRQSGS